MLNKFATVTRSTTLYCTDKLGLHKPLRSDGYESREYDYLFCFIQLFIQFFSFGDYHQRGSTVLKKQSVYRDKLELKRYSI